jgi:hypothetical protein
VISVLSSLEPSCGEQVSYLRAILQSDGIARRALALSAVEAAHACFDVGDEWGMETQLGAWARMAVWAVALPISVAKPSTRS